MRDRQLHFLVFLSVWLGSCSSGGTAREYGSARPPGTAAAETPAAWTAYFGSHDRPVDWGRSIRGVGRGLTGLLPGAEGRQTAHGRLSASAAELLDRYDLVIPVGGLASAKDADEAVAFLRQVESDSGRAWKQAVYDQAVLVGELSAGRGDVYWQVANEINSRDHGRAARLLAGGSVYGRRDDPAVIPVYVEYHLAPTVEALRRARDSLGDQTRLHIVLGSIATSSRRGAREWLEELLRYEVRGDYAPDLAGRRVYELVDVIAIHYLVTDEDDSWREILSGLYGSWVESGKVEGLWATEELGRRRATDGLGAATTLRVASRFLSWWRDAAIGPERSRVFFWGWRMGAPGTLGGEGMQALYDFFGETALADLRNVTVTASAEVEVHAFQSVVDQHRRALVILTREGFGSVNISGIALGTDEWRNAVSGRLHVFDREGHRVERISASREQFEYRFALPVDFVLARPAAAILTIEHQESS